MTQLFARHASPYDRTRAVALDSPLHPYWEHEDDAADWQDTHCHADTDDGPDDTQLAWNRAA